jgi:hypothetical protein
MAIVWSHRCLSARKSFLSSSRVYCWCLRKFCGTLFARKMALLWCSGMSASVIAPTATVIWNIMIFWTKMRGVFHRHNVNIVVFFYYLFNCYVFRSYDHLQAGIFSRTYLLISHTKQDANTQDFWTLLFPFTYYPSTHWIIYSVSYVAETDGCAENRNRYFTGRNVLRVAYNTHKGFQAILLLCSIRILATSELQVKLHSFTLRGDWKGTCKPSRCFKLTI